MSRSPKYGQLGLVLAFAVSIAWSAKIHATERAVDLSGEWSFRLDPEDRGRVERWYDTALPDRIQLPGMLQAQGYGDPPGPESQWLAGIGLKRANDSLFAPYWTRENFRSPFFLTPPRHYVGPAWYQREVTIPEDWQGDHIVLFLERVHWQSTLWIDDREVGSQNSLATPHVYDLSEYLTPGKHRLTISVDNRYLIPVGKSAHSISDETQGNWNGIVGRMELRRRPPVWIDDVQVYPDVAQHAVEVEITLGNRTGVSGHGQLLLAARAHAAQADSAPAEQFRALEIPVRWDADGLRQRVRYSLDGRAKFWDEFHPVLYDLTVELKTQDRGEGTYHDVETVTFGLRQLEVRGTQFVLNGRPIFLRGTLECCIFPREGHPPTDVESWKRILSVARSYGLNHLRFHSWCPPEAAFVAADEMGFYYQVECSCWASFGNGEPQDALVYAEAARIRRTYGNHPSFLLMVASNEPGGPSVAKRDAFLTKWVETQKAADPRRCYSAGSGWPQLPANQYHVTPAPRLQAWGPLQLNKPGQTWLDYREFIAKAGIPVVSHEIGQWCAYPNVVSEPEKYTGFFRGSNMEVFRDILQKKGLYDQAADFIRASGRFQVILYKQEIEAALRTPGMAGFQLLDLHDFPGQGTAPVGVLDAFWESKGYCSPGEYRRFCNSTVPLARLKKFVWTNQETLEFQLDLAHYGPEDLKDAVLKWELCQENPEPRVIAAGQTAPRDYPTGQLTEGSVQSVDLRNVPAPAVLRLKVCLENSDVANDWKIWVYPAEVSTEVPDQIALATDPHTAWTFAQEGRTVLFIPERKWIGGDTLGTFQPIFWNRITFPTQKVHMVGILCDPEHPALKDFPTDFHTDWQWQELLDACTPMVLDGLARDLRPIVQAIDDWCEARKLGLLWEARVGNGRLLVCSMDVLHDLSTRVVARQLRSSLIRYMLSENFRPAVTVTEEQWQTLWRKPRLLETLGAKATADSFQPGYEPSLAIDGDPQTMWHTAWDPVATPLPHEIIVDLGEPVLMAGVKVRPRQDDNPNGRIAEFAVFVSDDSQAWGDAIVRGTWDGRPIERVIRFPRPIRARFFKIVALSEIRGQPFTSIAEIDVIPADQR